MHRPHEEPSVITADQLRRRVLSSSYRSDRYDRAEVDRYLDLATETLASLEAGRSGSESAATMLLHAVRDVPFEARVSGAGYDAVQVEALRAGVVAALETYLGQDAAPIPASIEPTPSAPTAVTAVTPQAPPPAQVRREHGGPPAPGLSAFDLVMRVQSARTTLLGTQATSGATERLVLQTPDGTLCAVTRVETTTDGIVLHHT